jgi:hypothetical protein
MNGLRSNMRQNIYWPHEHHSHILAVAALTCVHRMHAAARSLSPEEARCKQAAWQAAWQAAESREMWERFKPKRVTTEPVKLSETGIHYYLDQKRFDRVEVAIPSGGRVGWHPTYIGVTVARGTYEVLDMYESFWP